MTGIKDAIKKAIGNDAFDKAWSPQTKMAIALNATGKQVYAGTVSAATIAKRRAKNKRARISRRATR